MAVANIWTEAETRIPPAWKIIPLYHYKPYAHSSHITRTGEYIPVPEYGIYRHMICLSCSIDSKFLALSGVKGQSEPFQNRSPVLGTNYEEFEWFVPKTGLRF